MNLEPRGKNVLLLQGPNGPFFRRLARQFREAGAVVTKVNFNPGDALYFSGPNTIAFRRPMADWSKTLRGLVEDRNIDAIYLFGDCRPHHKVAVTLGNELGIPVWVFEEGYIRPLHVTLELGGVNGNSSMSKEADFFRREAAKLPEPAPARRVKRAFFFDAWYTTFYAISCTLFAWRYPHYRHHRNVNFVLQMCLWVWGAARKHLYLFRQRRIVEKVTGDWSRKFYLAPLQVHCDFQFNHAPFEHMEEVIETVLKEFAAHANPEHKIVFKHHPHDRAYTHYGALLRELAGKYGLGDRVVYCHDLHLPTLLRNAIGTVTMNSTVGLSSIQEKTPVKVLGTAIYNFPGMTYQGSLAAFFRDPGEVDHSLYRAFVKWLLFHNQMNGSFHRRMPGIPTPTGLFSRTGGAFSGVRGDSQRATHWTGLGDAAAVLAPGAVSKATGKDSAS